MGSDNYDLSEDLIKEMKNANGNAIVNLTIKAYNDWLWLLTSLIPILPNYVYVEIEGDVVRL
ncbi:MAG: hypothetical protein V1874_06035 [Spirochaetota bacterium]